jgi:uncharacterized protein (DUF1015 family)
MARLYPFRALRYDPARVNLEAVVTQPYDKITPAMQQRYYEASPYNLVRVILGKHEPGDNEEHNVYTRAAEYLRDWRREHILAEESEPAVYGYSQTYLVPGTNETRERRGFIALGHLYEYADKVVYRHEQTFPKHKSDRLALFKATRAYCEQIYMLYSDPGFTAEKLIFDSDGKTPGQSPADLAITDEYGVVHKVWKLTDPNLINLLLTTMADKKLIIADGHHRYETSVTYAKQRGAQLKLPLNQPLDEDERLNPSHLPLPTFPEAAMMMTFVNMDAPGITILPTHRVVTEIENFSSPDFITKASAFYAITELDQDAQASSIMDSLKRSPGDSFLAVTPDGNYLLTPKPECIAPLLANLPSKQRQLGVAQLHAVVLDHLLGLTEDKIRATGNIQYLREATEAVALVESGEANIAFLIKPITLDQLKDVSLSGEVMPQKSTDFYPKLLSGLAIYALD